jgi:ATP-dependent DNA ligase
MLGDADLRAKKLDMRKAILADLLHGCGEPVRYCDHVIGVGREFFEIVRDAGLEGVVAKRRSSAYAGVLNDDWLKNKCLRVHDFVVGGWISDADKKIGALLLGEFIDGNLRYVGQVGSPSDWRVMRAVTRLLSPRATSPIQRCDKRCRCKVLRTGMSRRDRVHGLHRRWVSATTRISAVRRRGGHQNRGVAFTSLNHS